MNRPSLTAAQIVATLTAGVPIVSQLLLAFGVYTVSPPEQQALTNAINWAVPFAGLLIAGDAGLRAARNHAEAKIQAVEAVRALDAATPPARKTKPKA